MLEFHQQFSRGFALDQRHDLARRQVWRTRQQDMNVVARNGTLQDFDFLRPTNFPNQIAEPDFACQNPFAVLRHPDKVKLDIKPTVRTVPVVFLPSILATKR